MNVEQALDILEILGCGDDPVFHAHDVPDVCPKCGAYLGTKYGKEEISACELIDYLCPSDNDVENIYISYYKKGDSLCHGTLSGMVKDRLKW